MDAEDPRPPSPITDAELRESPSSGSANGATQQVVTAGVKPPTQQHVSTAAGDDEVTEVTKKVLEYRKDVGGRLETGEDEEMEKYAALPQYV